MSERLRVLIVEDNQGDVDLIREALPDTGPVSFQIETVSRLSEALARLKSGGTDLVLLDLGLPDSQGLETFHKLRKASSQIPIIILTGNDNQEVAVTAVREGAQDFLIKGQLGGSSQIMRAVRYAVERKKTEKELLKSEKEFHSLAESMPQIVWVTRKDGWNIYFNQQWVDYTGQTLEESYGHGWNKPFHPDDQQKAWDAWEDATKNNGIYSIESRLRRADGDYRWFLIRGVPFLDETGEIIKWFGTCTDIDDLKQAAEDQKNTQRLLAISQHLAHIGSWETELSTGKLSWSDEMFRIFGFPEAAPAYLDMALSLFPPDELVRFREAVASAIRGDAPYNIDYTIMRHDGQSRIIHEEGEVVFDENGIAVQMFGTTQDITKRKQAEVALRESEERFRKLFEYHAAVKILVDPDTGNIIEANKAAVQYYGWSREHLLQMNMTEINTLTPKELKKEIEKVRTNKQTYFEFRHRLADGSIRDVEVYSSNIEEGRSLLHSIIHDVTDRKAAEQELERYRHHLEKMILERTEGLEKEIMEHRHTEQALRTAKEAAEMANRTKSVFLSSMSHEFRTPLTAIIGFSDVLNKQYFGPLNDKQMEFLGSIVDSGKHLLALIGDILDLAKIEAGKEYLNCTPVSIPELLVNCISMIKEKTRIQGIEVCIENEKSLGDIKLIADIRRLKQVIYNLLSNAAKFTPSGGRIIIRVKEVPYAEPARKECFEFIEVSVTDTGIGLTQGDLGKVFEEFHQVNANTRDKNPGTGLGLALAQRIVRMHGGHIWAESAGLGQGSTFIFRIPCPPR